LYINGFFHSCFRTQHLRARPLTLRITHQDLHDRLPPAGEVPGARWTVKPGSLLIIFM
jgi:hypothetical protein